MTDETPPISNRHLLPAMGFTDAPMPRGAILERAWRDLMRLSRSAAGVVLLFAEFEKVVSIEQLADAAEARRAKNDAADREREARIAEKERQSDAGIAQREAEAARREEAAHERLDKIEADERRAQARLDTINGKISDAERSLAEKLDAEDQLLKRLGVRQ